MKVIVGPRQSGKTTRLLKMAKSAGGIYVATHSQMADSAARMSERMGIDAEVSFLGKKPSGSLFIDEVQYALAQATGINYGDISAVAVSGVVDYDYDERKDYDQYEDFRRFKKGLTYRQFVEMKYGVQE